MLLVCGWLSKSLHPYSSAFYLMNDPPVTGRERPVRKSAPSEAKKETAWARSLVWARRPSGVLPAAPDSKASVASFTWREGLSNRFVMWPTRSVGVRLGHMALTVIPNSANSWASDCVKPTMPNLDEQ